MSNRLLLYKHDAPASDLLPYKHDAPASDRPRTCFQYKHDARAGGPRQVDHSRARRADQSGILQIQRVAKTESGRE